MEGWGWRAWPWCPHLCGGAAERLQVPEATAPISVKTVSRAPQTQPLSSGTEPPHRPLMDTRNQRRLNGIPTLPPNSIQASKYLPEMGSPTENWNHQGHHSCPWTELRVSRTEDGVPGTTLSSLTGTGGPQGLPGPLAAMYSTRALSWPTLLALPSHHYFLPLFSESSQKTSPVVLLQSLPTPPRTGHSTWLGEDWGARGRVAVGPQCGCRGLARSGWPVLPSHGVPPLCGLSSRGGQTAVVQQESGLPPPPLDPPSSPHFLYGHLHEVVKWGRTQHEGSPGALTPPARQPLLQPSNSIQYLCTTCLA